MTSLVVDTEPYTKQLRYNVDGCTSSVITWKIDPNKCMGRVYAEGRGSQCCRRFRRGSGSEFCKTCIKRGLPYGRADELPPLFNERGNLSWRHWPEVYHFQTYVLPSYLEAIDSAIGKRQTLQEKLAALNDDDDEGDLETLRKQGDPTVTNFFGDSFPTSPISFKGLSTLEEGANDLRTNNLSRNAPKKKRQTPKQKTKAVRKSAAQKRKEARAIQSKKRREALAARRNARQFTSEIYGYRMNELVWCLEKDTFVPHYHWLYVGQTKRGLDVRDKEHRTTGHTPFDLALQSEKYADAEIVLLEKITCRSEEERQRVTDFKEQEWMLKLKTLRKFKVEVFNTVNARHHIQSAAELNENAEKLRQEALIAEELAKRANY